MREEGDRSIYLSLYCHHQNDSCIKMGSDTESHFNVSFIVRDKVTRQCPQTTTFEEKGERMRIRTEIHLLSSLTPYLYARLALYATEGALYLRTAVHRRCQNPANSLRTNKTVEAAWFLWTLSTMFTYLA